MYVATAQILNHCSLTLDVHAHSLQRAQVLGNTHDHALEDGVLLYGVVPSEVVHFGHSASVPQRNSLSPRLSGGLVQGRGRIRLPNTHNAIAKHCHFRLPFFFLSTGSRSRLTHYAPRTPVQSPETGSQHSACTSLI